MYLNIESYKFMAGDTWIWYETPAGYSVNEYSLSVILKKSTGTAITIVATVSEGKFKLLKEDTSSVAAGDYNFAVKVTESSTSYTTTIATGIVTVLPNIASADPRSYAQKMYETLKTAYETMGAQVATEVQFGDRKVRYERADLLQQVLYWEGRAAKEPRRMKKFLGRM